MNSAKQIPLSTEFSKSAHAQWGQGGVTTITSLLRHCIVLTMAKSLAELRRMNRGQLGRVTKEDLIDSILAINERDDNLILTLTEKLDALVAEVAGLKTAVTSPESVINKRLENLQKQVDKQADIIAKQQRFLETLDRKERESNLVILGVPDDNETLDGGVTDENKLKKIWEKVEVNEEIRSHKRLGNLVGNRKRPILVTLAGREVRDKILEKASALKESGEAYSRIYIKRDVHPSVRNEWKRLRDAERNEKERPENVGCVVRLDTRERKLYRDGIVIDTWNQQFF